MSRKTILFIIAIIGAIIGFFGDQFGVALSGTAVAGGLTAIVVYLFGEMKNDIARVKNGIIQEKKWKDPAFWTALVASLLPVINTNLNLNLPVDTIVATLSGILAFIFGYRQKQLND